MCRAPLANQDGSVEEANCASPSTSGHGGRTNPAVAEQHAHQLVVGVAKREVLVSVAGAQWSPVETTGGREGLYDARMAVVKPEPVDPVDEELAELLDNPAVRERLDDFERRRGDGELGKAASHNEARRIVGLPPLPDDDPRL
jgi:hypothetical protein